MKSVPSVEIHLDDVKKEMRLYIEPRVRDTLFDSEGSALENNEARFQLVEGCFYDYQINDDHFILGDIGENIIQTHKRNFSLGTIAPNIFTGTLEIPLIKQDTGVRIKNIFLEVQSAKVGYRNDYRDMLEFITEKCTDLLLQANSPVSQTVDINHEKDSRNLYQRFTFIKSIIQTDEFTEAIHKIVTSPVTKWVETYESKDIRSSQRLSNSTIKEILKGGKRTKLPETSWLKNYGIQTLPERINSIRKSDSVDTPENRFIKHALETFLKLCADINHKAKEFGHINLQYESEYLIRSIESQLHHSIFKHISRPTTLKLNSPVLQRKEGYREVLRIWLIFDLAAKLIWRGGEDVYGAGKKDIATLYEYWLFFKLLDMIQSIFDITSEEISSLIQPTPDGLSLQIKQGKNTAFQGIYNSSGRNLNIRFNYNRSFSGKKKYPDSGSWTTTLRPDFTISCWPLGISEEVAEKEELIVHVHFDAKYKVDNLLNLIDQSTGQELDEEKIENRKGLYKNIDLLKMHAYRDAIRRTGGAYILYPGNKEFKQQGFREIIPGLGAFPVRPSKTDTGIGDLKTFILDIINHFIDRTTQREKLAFRTFEIFQNPPETKSKIKEPLPEAFGSNRDLIPDYTYVLVGFYKSPQHYEWIKKNRLYNFRMGSGTGSLILDSETINAKYLLLHTTGDKTSSDLWKIVSKGLRVFSKKDLEQKDYPSPKHDNYLIINIEKVTNPEFENVKWDFSKLKNYSSARASAYPFTASLTELMKFKTEEIFK